MREGPSASVLAGAARWWPQISAWHGADLLADDVPVLSGRISADATAQVPERLTFTVPEFSDGRSWVPTDPRHPLAQYGQHVDVDIHVQSPVTGITTTTRMGRFLVQSWDAGDDGQVSVEAVGLLQRCEDARFRVPQVPRPTGTLVSEFRRLMVPGMPVQVSDQLRDRGVPQSFEWEEDRLGALYDIADAWPARIRVDQFGTVRVLPPVPAVPVPVLRLTDGQGGTVISAPREGNRDDVVNVVVARSSQTDAPAQAPQQAVAVVTHGPLAPETYGEVVMFWSSPLAATTAQLKASADSILARKVRPAIQQHVSCAPDPRIDLDDPVELVRDGRVSRGYVVGYDLPLTLDGGSMRLTVGVG